MNIMTLMHLLFPLINWIINFLEKTSLGENSSVNSLSEKSCRNEVLHDNSFVSWSNFSISRAQTWYITSCKTLHDENNSQVKIAFLTSALLKPQEETEKTIADAYIVIFKEVASKLDAMVSNYNQMHASEFTI